MNRKILVSILLLFLVLFVLFMFSAFSTGLLTQPETNSRGTDVSAVTGDDALLFDAFATESGAEQTQAASAAANPLAVLISADADDLAIFREWCAYTKHRYQAYPDWPDVSALDDASVVLVGRMEYGADALKSLESYAQTGVTLMFTRLPDYGTLAGNPELADFFGISACVEPACEVDGLKVFGGFFLSEERIYTAGDFYGEADDTRFSVPYYTLRAGYEGYMVGLLDDQDARGIDDEKLPTLLWRTYTGKSQVCAVNTDLFDGERMLGVLTAFVSATSDWALYPVVNARAIMMTGFPFLSDENSETMRQRYSRDTLGFERDIVWPNVVKVFRNYGAVPNFFVSPEFDYADAVDPVTDDLAAYLRQIQSLSGTVGLSLTQTSGLPLAGVAQKAQSFFGNALPDFRFYAAYAGDFTDAQWQSYLAAGPDEMLSELSLLLFPYREGRALFTFENGDVLTALMTADGFAHETMDDLQLISLMTALGYSAQQVDMSRALLPAGDGDDWSNLSVTWSKGDTYYNDFTAFDSASVYDLETRVRRMLGANYACVRDGDTLSVSVSAFEEEFWFVLRLHGETVSSVSGGEATMISGTAWLVRLDQADAAIELARTDTLSQPAAQGGDPQ
jgi:hypothetical protein